jgi:hypothetical protein
MYVWIVYRIASMQSFCRTEEHLKDRSVAGYTLRLLSPMVESPIYSQFCDVAPVAEDFIHRSSQDRCCVWYAGQISALIVVFGFLIAMVITAWSVRGLTLLVGRSKTNLVNRINDVARDETIPLNEVPPLPSTGEDSRRSSEAAFDVQGIAELLHPPSRTAEASRVRGPGVELPPSRHDSSADIVDNLIQPRPITKTQRTAGYITLHLDALTWALFWLVGFCVYMGTDYSMPTQLPLNVLTFFLAMKLSPSVRRFIHPIFPCVALTILGIFVLSAIKRESFDEGLRFSKCI